MEIPGMDSSWERQSMATTRETAIPDTSAETTGTADPDTGRDPTVVSH